MSVSILAPAQAEFEEAVERYNTECPGLGYEFADEVFRSIERIQANPKAWQRLSPRTRRCLTRRFPYAVIYQAKDDEILVVAVMHLHRHPDSWRKRMKKC